jgi:hemolysin activation/secretion protein
VGVLDRERARTQPAPRSQPQIKITEDRQPSEADASVQFTLKFLRIEGATVFSEAELLAPYAKLNGQRISFETLNAITAELTKKYRDNGFILSRVLLPAQDVDQLAATIQLYVVEGFISTIQYEGDQNLVGKFQKRFESVERKLLSKKPLKHKDFEREMLILQDLPGIKVSSRFQEGSIKSGSILVLKLSSEAISASLGWNNSGTASAGPGLSSASFSLNSLPILGWSTTLSYNQADHRKEYYSMTVAQSYQFVSGLVLSASFARSHSPKPDTDFARLFDYATDSKTFNLNVSYPLIRSRDMNLSLGMGYEYRDSHADLMMARFNRDRLRNLSVNANFDFSDEWGGVTQLITTVTQGLKVAHASDQDLNSSNTLARAKYIKADVYLSRNQRLPYDLSFLLASEVMFSDQLLASYNRFSFGGGQFGRGYDSGILEGDNAFAVSFEPRWTYNFNENLAIQPFAFIDYGRVWNNLEQVNVPDSQFGSSFGGGVRFWGSAGGDRPLKFNLSVFGGRSMKKIGDEKSSRVVFMATFYI